MTQKFLFLYSISDATFISLAVFVSFIVKGKGYSYLLSYRWYFVAFFLIWVFASLGTRKYNIGEDNARNSLVKAIYTVLIVIGFVSFIVYFITDFRELSRFVIYGSILFVTLFDLVFATAFHGLKNFQLISEPKLRDNNKTIFEVEGEKKEGEGSEKDLSTLPPLDENETPLSETLEESYFPEDEGVREFLGANLSLERISDDETEAIDTEKVFNISHFGEGSQRVFINKVKVNDIRNIDEFFSQVNSNLKYGGYFVGKGVTIAEKYENIMEKYPPVVNYLVYYLDFLVTRAMPKISSLRGLHRLVTGGKNKAISRAEILGRLQYSGFKPVAVSGIGGFLHFIGKKVDTPKEDEEPTYGLLIKLERVGKGGKLFNLYKFRTMHPYSEYIQDYVYDSNALDSSGKIKNDFRITTWGRVLRKFYIDEAPQFYNIWKGDLGLVGVRALSKHYFNLYPEDLQKRRVKFKPGLVPPYYVHLPEGLEEIVESERKYLDEKEERPLVTDIKYFCLAWRNILFRRGGVAGKS